MKSKFTQALFAAGLCLLCIVSAAAEEEEPSLGIQQPRGRRVLRATPRVVPTAVPQVSKQDLSDLQKKLDMLRKDFLDNLSRQQAKEVYQQEIQKKQAQDFQKIETELQVLNDLELDLKKVQSALTGHQDDIEVLNDTVGAMQKSLSVELSKVQKFRDDFTAKSERLEGVIDLMNATRKDINDNSRGLVDLQNDLEKIKHPEIKRGSSGWFEKMVRWPYMPAVAAGLSAVALGIEASK